MRWIPLAVGLLLGPPGLAWATEPARTHEELDRRIDGLARAADETLGARLKAKGAPPSVVADLGRIVEAARPRLHAVQPMANATRPGVSAVVGFGAGLDLDSSSLTASWNDPRPELWRAERSIAIVDDVIRQQTKGDGVVRERTLTPVAKDLRLGSVTIPAGSWAVRTSRREHSPLGPNEGRLLGSSGFWVRPDGSHQDMRGPYSAPIPRSVTGPGGRGTSGRQPARAGAPRPAPR